MKWLLGILIIGMCAGCASSNQAYKDRNETVIGQTRNADVMKITGTNISFTITGATEICFSQIVNPINAPATALETVTAGAVSVAQIAAPIAGGVLLARELSDRADNVSYTEKVSDTFVSDSATYQSSSTTSTTK